MTREEFEKAKEEREKAVHFRTIEVPCCGNCRYFTYGDFSGDCENPDNITEEPWGSVVWHRPLLCPSEHNVCDCFAPKGEETEDA